jgi:hypothetical protein
MKYQRKASERCSRLLANLLQLHAEEESQRLSEATGSWPVDGLAPKWRWRLVGRSCRLWPRPPQGSTRYKGPGEGAWGWAFEHGAGDENRTRTVSLGS